MKQGISKSSASNQIDDKFIVEDAGSVKEIVYEKLALLGRGTFSKVYQCVQMDSKQVFAIKIVSKAFLVKNNLKEQFTKEIKIHFMMEHQNIIKLYKVFENRGNIFMVLEFSENGTIADLIERRKSLSEVEIRYYFRSMIEAVKYIHSKSIVHRDLKPANLIISSKMELKVADFGLANYILEGQRRKTFCGTPFFIAPEILNKKGGHSFEVDWWSAGVVLYNMAYGRCPFHSETTEIVYSKIKEEPVPIEDSRSPQLNDLLCKLLAKSAAERAGFSECSDHPFLKRLKGPDFLPAHFLETAPSESFIGRYETLVEKSSDKVANPNDENVYICEPSGTSSLENTPGSSEKEDTTGYCYVKKWVNFSEKFGLGYTLNDGSLGILFIDRTKIVLSNFGITFHYFSTEDGRSCVEMHNIINYPPGLEKKVKILEFFIAHLKSKGHPQNFETPSEEIVYLKNYKISKSGVLFYLSNGVYQTIFEDGTEVHINKLEETKRLVFIDKNRQRSFSDGKNLTDPILVARVKHIKELLKTLNS